MRIGVLTTSYPQSPGDSAGSFVMHMAHALAERGHQVDVCAPEPAALPPEPKHNGVTTQWVPYLRPRSLQRSFYKAGVLDNLKRDPLAWCGVPSFMVMFNSAVRRQIERWDSVISHWALPSGLIASRLRGERPHIAVLHSADVHLLRRLPFAASLASKIACGADHLVFVSAALRDIFRSSLEPSAHNTFDAKAHVLPMGFACQLSSSGSTREALRAQLGMTKFTVLIVARLVPIKGIDIALAAMRSVSSAELWVAGDGPQGRHLQTLAVQLGTNVRWLGHVSAALRDQLLNAADVLVAPSRVLPSGRTEGMPCSVLEAMYAGLPVIASAVGGIPEWVRPGDTGWLVPPDDPSGLAEAIRHVQSNPNEGRRRGVAASHAVAHLTWDHQAAFYEHLLKLH